MTSTGDAGGARRRARMRRRRMNPQARDFACQELVDLVTDYLEEALSRADRAWLDAHLVGCPGCQAYVDQMRTTLEVLRATRALEDPPDVSRLLEAFRRRKHNGSPHAA